MKKLVNKLNKRGQDLSIGTLILIVLGIVVLVLLILGFSMGWENLWEKINIFGGGSSISTVVTACDGAALQNNEYGYCQDFKKVKVDGKTQYMNCEDTRIQNSLDNKLICNQDDVKAAKETLCATLKEQGKGDTKIHSKDIVETCDSIVPSGCLKEESDCTGIEGNNEAEKQTACTTAAACEWDNTSKSCKLKTDAETICKQEPAVKESCDAKVGCKFVA